MPDPRKMPAPSLINVSDTSFTLKYEEVNEGPIPKSFTIRLNGLIWNNAPKMCDRIKTSTICHLENMMSNENNEVSVIAENDKGKSSPSAVLHILTCELKPFACCTQ